MDEDLSLNKNTDIDSALKEFEGKKDWIITPKPLESEDALGSQETIPLPKRTDISGALKEFEKTQDDTTTPQNLDIIDAMRSQKLEIPQISDTPKMIAFIMKYSGGLIKNEKQASIVLVILSLAMFGLSIYFFLGGSIGTGVNIPPPMINPQPGVGIPGVRP